MEARARVSRDESGKATRVLGVNLDITSRKDVEERIQTRDNQLRLVTDSVPALISYVDKNERYRLANETYTDWFGIPKDDVIGKQPREVFGNSAIKILKPWIRKALSGERCSFETVLSYDGIEERHVSVSYIPDIGADGTVNGYIGLTHDRTALRLLRTFFAQPTRGSDRSQIVLPTTRSFRWIRMGSLKPGIPAAEIIFGYTTR